MKVEKSPSMPDSAGQPPRANCPSTGTSASQQLAQSVSADAADAVTDIVAACQEGDRNGQRRLFELFQRSVFRVALRMVGADDAPDLTQQVFLQVFRTINQFSGRSRFETWLHRLTINECLQHIRRKKPVHTLRHDPVGRSPAHTTQIEQKELLEQALGRLDPDLRAIFVLREVEGMNYRQIAETLDVSEGTVGSRLNRARGQLKEYLVELGWEP